MQKSQKNLKLKVEVNSIFRCTYITDSLFSINSFFENGLIYYSYKMVDNKSKTSHIRHKQTYTTHEDSYYVVITNYYTFMEMLMNSISTKFSYF